MGEGGGERGEGRKNLLDLLGTNALVGGSRALDCGAPLNSQSGPPLGIAVVISGGVASPEVDYRDLEAAQDQSPGSLVQCRLGLDFLQRRAQHRDRVFVKEAEFEVTLIKNVALIGLDDKEHCDITRLRLWSWGRFCGAVELGCLGDGACDAVDGSVCRAVGWRHVLQGDATKEKCVEERGLLRQACKRGCYRVDLDLSGLQHRPITLIVKHVIRPLDSKADLLSDALLSHLRKFSPLSDAVFRQWLPSCKP